MEKSPCGACNSLSYRFWRLKFDQKTHERIECCSECENIRPQVWRDADGQRVLYDESMTGKYSYATDTVWTSKKDLAEHCKKHGLIQKGQ